MISMNQIRRRGDLILAWVSLLLAIVGGALGAGSGIGIFIRHTVGALPWPWVPAVALAVAFIALALDLFHDGEPNQVAIVGAILLPSLAASTHGGLAHWVVHESTALSHAMLPHLQSWVGTTSATGLSLGATLIAVVVSQRVAPGRGRSGGGGGRRSRSRTAIEVS